LPQVVAEHPGAVRITAEDQTQVTLVAPKIVSDSIVGFVAGTSARAGVLLTTVRSYSIKRFDAGKTILLVAGLGAAGVLFLIVAGVAFFDAVTTRASTVIAR
jgi:hypothetical protein